MKQHSSEIKINYSYIVLLQRYIMRAISEGCIKKTPMMTLSIRTEPLEQQVFTDLRELTELAAEVRRLDNPATKTEV